MECETYPKPRNNSIQLKTLQLTAYEMKTLQNVGDKNGTTKTVFIGPNCLQIKILGSLLFRMRNLQNRVGKSIGLT
jgi:hypothetical protein